MASELATAPASAMTAESPVEIPPAVLIIVVVLIIVLLVAIVAVVAYMRKLHRPASAVVSALSGKRPAPPRTTTSRGPAGATVTVVMQPAAGAGAADDALANTDVVETADDSGVALQSVASSHSISSQDKACSEESAKI